MRSMSLNAREETNASVSSDDGVFLLTFTHPALPNPVRLSSDATELLQENPRIYGTRSRGEEYLFLPMQAQIPSDQEEQAPRCRLVLDNVVAEDDDGTTTSASDLVKLSPLPPRLKIEVVLLSNPDQVEASAPDLFVINATYDAGTVTMDISVDDQTAEPFPALSFTPGTFPTLF